MDRRAFLAASAALPVTGAVAEAVAGLPAETTTADAELLRLGDELDRAWAHEKALIDSETWGDTYETAYEASRAVVGQIEQQQAHTLEGLRVKARAVMWCHQGDEMDGEPFSLTENQTTDVRLAESIVLELVEL